MSPLHRAHLPRLGEARRQVRPLVAALDALYRIPGATRAAIPLHALLQLATATRARVHAGPSLLLDGEAATAIAGVLHGLLHGLRDAGAQPARLRWKLERDRLRLELSSAAGQPVSELAAGLARAELRELGGRLSERPGSLGIELPLERLRAA